MNSRRMSVYIDETVAENLLGLLTAMISPARLVIFLFRFHIFIDHFSGPDRTVGSVCVCVSRQ